MCDNRQLNALKSNFTQVGKVLLKNQHFTSDELKGAQNLIKKVVNAQSFKELYKLLNFEYKLCESGTLIQFSDEYFDLVFSMDVLEHINEDILADSIKQYFQIIKGIH